MEDKAGTIVVGFNGKLGVGDGVHVAVASFHTKFSDSGNARTAEIEGITLSQMKSGALLGGASSNQLALYTYMSKVSSKGCFTGAKSLLIYLMSGVSEFS